MRRTTGTRVPCGDDSLDSPENDEAQGSGSGVSYRDLGLKIYEALAGLPVVQRLRLAQATTNHMSGEQIDADPSLTAALRRLRYPESPDEKIRNRKGSRLLRPTARLSMRRS